MLNESSPYVICNFHRSTHIVLIAKICYNLLGSGKGLVALAVFKTVGRRLCRLRWVRFPPLPFYFVQFPVFIFVSGEFKILLDKNYVSDYNS